MRETPGLSHHKSDWTLAKPAALMGQILSAPAYQRPHVDIAACDGDLVGPLVVHEDGIHTITETDSASCTAAEVVGWAGNVFFKHGRTEKRS